MNLQKKRAQSSTEYIIVLGGVLIVVAIAITLVGLLEGVGTTATTRSQGLDNTQLPVAITGFSSGPTQTVVILKNTLTESISVTNMSIDGTVLNSSFFPLFLDPSDAATLTSTTFTTATGTRFQFNTSIEYRLDVTGGTFTQDDAVLVGVGANS